MNDVAKCQGTACSQKQDCWRYRAPEAERQDWGNFWQGRPPGPCADYLPMTRERWAAVMAAGQTREAR